MEIIDKIKQSAQSLRQELSDIRRHLHMNPELSLKEHKTAAFIASKLDEYNIRYEKGIAVTGLVGYIEGKNPGSRTIALRADMDALPINEENDVEYKSITPGVMHACGHDLHMTCLLGAAKILQQFRDELTGTVKLIFQPSEETFPGGASMMIKEGILENPKPSAIFGQHVLPELEAGKIGLKAGQYMASTDEIYLTVHGKGGHGATPDLNIDTVVIASHIIIALQQIVSRNATPTIPSVLSFGSVKAEGRTNIIPNEVKIAGTFRTFNEKWRADAHEKITRLAKGIAESMGGSCDVFIDKGYPFLVNDADVTLNTREAAVRYLGAENVVDLAQRMTAEDFAYYSQLVPACFYRLGVRNESKGIIHNLHTSRFDADEKSLETGAGLMAYLAVNALK
jgi:amidohydrolase